MRNGALRGCLICLASLSSLALAETKLQHPNEAPKVEAKEKTNNRLEPHQDPAGVQNTPAPVDLTKSATEVRDSGSKPNLNDAKEDGTEFWPSLFGYKVKVTDSLLVLFTFMLWLATRSLVKGAEESSREELRAYVSANIAGMRDVAPDKNIIISFHVFNIGKTPAFSVRQSGEIVFADHPLPENFRFQNIPVPKSKATVFPNIPFLGNIIAANKFTQAQIIEGLQGPAIGGKRFYIFGRIDYIDIFKTKRWTTFCFSFSGYHAIIPSASEGKWNEVENAFLKLPPGSALGFDASLQHNETDNG
jgi:hypothetical protein